eukprot:CAMPEP_0204825866 /NCGR_PEP_ID=MMETSP1346-20131115/3663_1 /ASSEMBLY_ACC=CAM_ASM_000771 /TAXON_ID=215587 /ORGANISM="Aplanochytrium stocchinoi, Strain GSBS06" /LENGTH=542 /DNA_ID=CAMNT_0051953639 /DNA_START=102 /DNA_END=1730 /DNA_ORIENTATION=+
MEKENTRSQQGSSSGAATASELSEIENEKENMFPSAKKARIVSDFAVKPTAAIITEDISNGQEPVPIRVVNETGDGDVLPEDFKYINRYVMRDVRIWNMDKEDLYGKNVCCSCEGECLNHICECSKANIYKKFFYDKNGRLLDTGGTIRECSHLCSCDPAKCGNRVVQKGISKRFEVFKTKGKGWGLRTLERLKLGDFICEYFGEIMTEHFALLRARLYEHGDSYLLTPVIDREDVVFNDEHVDWPDPLEEYKVAVYVEDKTELDFFRRDNYDIIKSSMPPKSNEKQIEEEIKRQYGEHIEACMLLYEKEIDAANSEIEKINESEARICESLIPREVFAAKTDQGSFPREENTSEFLTIRRQLYEDEEVLIKLKSSVSALAQLSHIPQRLQVELRNTLLKKHGLHGEFGCAEDDDECDSVISEIKDKGLTFDAIPDDELDYEQQRIKRQRQESKSDDKLDSKVCVDPLMLGSVARFLNHSCTPNCCKVVVTGGQMMTWKHNGTIVHKPFTRLALFANRDIDPMEELTWNYGYKITKKDKMRV